MGKNLKEPTREQNELRAIYFAQELIDKYGVFDRCIISLVLDEAGIDILLTKRFEDGKLFRFHVQHKSSQKGAENFKELNPCIPTWIVNEKTEPIKAFVLLLNMVIAKCSEQESQYTMFFEDKLKELKSLFQYK